MVVERIAEKKVVEKHVKEYVYRSKLPDIEIPYHLPLHTYCFQNIDSYRHKPCIIHGSTGDVYTYGEVELATRRVAAGLHRLGIKRGEVVMILLPNSPEFAFSFLGASYRGVISTTANPLYTPSEIAKQASAAGARLVITMVCYVEKVLEMAAEREMKVVTIDKPAPPGCLHFSEHAGDDELPAPEVEISPDDVVTLPFSSGTTGLPKGVLLTHKGQVANVAQIVDGDNPNLHYRRDDVLLCVLPMYHIYCLSSVLVGGMRAGAALVVMQRFEIRAMMELVQKHRVTVVPIVPPIVLAITKSPLMDDYDLSSIRTVICGAAPMGRELEDALRVKLPNVQLGQGYGMTEAGAISMCLAFAKEPYEIKSGSCGTVVRNSELKIIDPNTGASLRRNESGEICVRGPQIMKGYLNNSEATQNIIDKEGWLHTGDIGFVDEEEELFIVDRLKEIIKYKGYQVAPAELEALLMAHPMLVDAAVVPMKDEVAGEVPVAFVVKFNDSAITEDEIKQFISTQVVFYKRINRVFFVDSIPKAPSGKLLRKDLREMLANGFPK